jgi:hypothetical protein
MPTLATIAEVEDRLALGRALTSAETDQITYLIGAVGESFSLVAGKDVTAIDPTPSGLGPLAVEKIVQAMRNNQGVIAESLGDHSVTFDRNGGSFALTDTEELAIRRAVYGRTTDSVVIRSHFQEVES